MPRYEYKVVPAPSKGQKAKGVKTPDGRFALAIETALNARALDGWEYVRAELLPSDERSGLTGSTVQWRNVLVFRRLVDTETDAFDARPVIAATGFEDPPMFPADPPLAAPVEEPKAPEEYPHLSVVANESEYDDEQWDQNAVHPAPEDEPQR